MFAAAIVVSTRGLSEPEQNLVDVDEDETLLALSDQWIEVSDLTFNGKRFEDHSLEFEVLPDLIQFQRIITALAAYYWRKDHPKKKKLPANFDQATRLRFSTIKPGSTTLPVETPIESSDTMFGAIPLPYVAKAIDECHAAVQSQEEGRNLPDDFPRGKYIDLLVNWGTTLQAGESIGLREAKTKTKMRAAESKQARFDYRTRKALELYRDAVAEEVLTLYGEVRAVDLDSKRSFLKLPNGHRVEVRFSERYAEAFHKALDSAVALTGVAIVNRIDGFIQRVVTVTDLILEGPSDRTQLIGVWLDENRKRVDWSEVPSDFSTKLDEYLYGE